MSKGEATDTLARLLNLVPVLYQNQGLKVKDLLPLTGYRKSSELRERLEELMFFGVPPFSPADLIDVYIDEEDRVFVDLTQGLERPNELSAEEWDAVRSVLQEALEVRRRDDLPIETITRLLAHTANVPISYDSGSSASSRRALIERALADDLQVEFLYRTPAAKEGEVRRVEPWALFFHHGAGYLVGYCHLRLDARCFHLERLERLEVLALAREHQPPEDLNGLLEASPIFAKAGRGLSVRLRFRAELRNVLEYQFAIINVTEAAPPGARDGAWLEAECKVEAPLWFRTVLRSLGPGVEILSPQHLREDFYEDLAALSLPAPL